MRTTLRTLLLTVALTLTAAIAWSQVNPPSEGNELDLAVTYSAQYNNILGGPTFWQPGGGTIELSGDFYRGLGAAANIGGYRASNIAPGGVNLTMVTTTFGPRYTWAPRSKRYALFGQGLVGQAYGLDSVFPQPSGAVTSFTTLALLVGGGVDYRFSRRLAVRPFQCEWLWTEFPNAKNNFQNNIRFSAGIVFRLQQR